MPGAALFPFAVSTLAWESRPGSWSLTVCLKATFALAPQSTRGTPPHPQGASDEPTLAAQQDGSHDDILFEQAPRASLYSPGDFVPYKPRADVLLVGHAHAPGGAAVDSLVVRMRLGDLSKALRVTGDRTWTETPQGPRSSPPRPFVHMPLRYERAFRKGENMAGLAAGDTSRPPPNVDVIPEEGPAETPGLGPIAPSWRALRDPRAQEALIWAQRLRSAPLGPPPAGLDPSVFNAAPRDQQAVEIAPSTPLLLENLHPRFARLETRLPSFVPSVFHVDPATGQPREIQARIDTLWIDTDREVFVVSWRGTGALFGAPGSAGVGRVLAAVHPPGATVTFEEVDALTRPKSVAPAAPLPGAPWAGMPSAPVPRPGKHLEGTLPIGASLAALVPPAAPGPANKPSKRTVAMEQMPPMAPSATPFPLAGPGTATAAEPVAGAPWAREAAVPVPRPASHLDSTMPLGDSLADALAKVRSGEVKAASAVQAAPEPPPVLAVPDPAPPPPPPQRPSEPPKVEPPKVEWRVDVAPPAPSPEAPPPATPAPPPAFERPAAAAVRGSFYSKFKK